MSEKEKESVFPMDADRPEGVDLETPTNAVPPVSVPVEDGLGEVPEGGVAPGMDHLTDAPPKTEGSDD